jgi:uncharacterized repeat protein (TIGR03806 family)
MFSRCLKLGAVILAGLFSLSCDMLGSGVRSYTEEPFPRKLSQWRLFVKEGATLRANQGVVPYDIITPLFSDYANKYRFVWMPAGTSASYDEHEAFDFPVGTILAKTFAYPADGEPNREKLIETRLLVHSTSGWVALPYVWNESQTDATLEVAAGSVEVSWTDASGQKRAIDYTIPNVNECRQCHDKSKTLLPIGPKARNLNRDFSYSEGVANQLEYWTKIGYLKGAPSSDSVRKVPAWNDPATGSLDERARAYLDNNCAHCHRAGGVAGYSGLLLEFNETDPRRLGLFKLPNSAGYTGNRPYDLVPGKPDDSILIYRMESTRPKEMMPEIGRSLPHREGIELLRQWITAFPPASGSSQ